MNYLQGWVLICVTEAKRLIGSKSEGRPQKEGWGLSYIDRVRITVHAGERGEFPPPGESRVTS